jgi:hypothetical protein
MTSGKRHQTTVPQQALFFMNSPLVVESAKNLVGRKDFIAISTDEDRVRFLYETFYQRQATLQEVQLGMDFVSQEPSQERVVAAAPANVRKPGRQPAPAAQAMMERQQARRGGREPMKARAPLNSWEEYAHALLQANEFCFVN